MSLQTPNRVVPGPDQNQSSSVPRTYKDLRGWLSQNTGSPLGAPQPQVAASRQDASATPKVVIRHEATPPESTVPSGPVNAATLEAATAQEISKAQFEATPPASTVLPGGQCTSADTAWFNVTKSKLEDVQSASSHGPTLVESPKSPHSSVHLAAAHQVQSPAIQPEPLQITKRQTGHDAIQGLGSDFEAASVMLTWSVSEVNGSQDNPQRGIGPSGPIRVLPDYGTEHHRLFDNWLDGATRAEFPTVKSLIQRPEGMDIHQHDIDPVTGRLMDKLEYPPAYKSQTRGPCVNHNDVAWRQANMTSELAIFREIESRRCLAAAAEARAREQEQGQEAQVYDEPAWPKAECTLRPALMSDLDDIANIINAEAQRTNGCQLLASKTVSQLDVKRVLDYCRANLRPFVVAISGGEDLTDRSNWPPGADKAYREYVRYKRTHPDPPPAVVGFAFISESRIGFLNTPCDGARHAGLVRLLVHPDYRRNYYGTALLDRIILSAAPFHKSAIDYTWECPSPDGVYEFPAARNKRQYTRLYMEVFAKGKKDPIYKWRAAMLAKLDFKLAARLREAIKTEEGYSDLMLLEIEIQQPDAPVSAYGD